MLDKIKDEMPVYLPSGQSAVDALIDPVYRNYVDLFLQLSNNANSSLQTKLTTSVSYMEATKGGNKADKLLTAINRMESIKNADLQSFLLSRCTDALDQHTDWAKQFLPEAVVFYPIVFNNRIELLTKKGETIQQHTINVPAKQLNEQVKKLLYALQNGKNYLPSSSQLHDWLINPILNDLNDRKTGTIVFVPDRSLRAMPLAALTDGKQFIVEQFSIVTLPSLELKNLYRAKAEKNRNQTLIAGISKPDGPSIDNLPKQLVKKLESRMNEGDNKLSAIDPKETRSKLVTALSLPSVEKEVNEIGNLTKAEPLLNQKFTANAFKDNIESANFSTVHIASHGYFGKNIKDSFIMAYDKNLSLHDFEGSLSIDKLKETPIDLLALSACETAESNDRMILGFSGIAVKSNALSAVGSLWAVNDEASMQLMRSFYANLNENKNRAKALQDSQIAMIKSKSFNHPYYWSPFVLVGNWY